MSQNRVYSRLRNLSAARWRVWLNQVAAGLPHSPKADHDIFPRTLAGEHYHLAHPYADNIKAQSGRLTQEALYKKNGETYAENPFRSSLT